MHLPIAHPMSPSLFCVFFLFGSGALTLWIDVRFPKLAPAGLGPTLIHLGAAAGVATFVVPIAMAIALHRNLQLAAVFCVGLPVLIYLLSTSLWIMKLLQGMMSSRFH
jgi:hypothetical protein